MLKFTNLNQEYPEKRSSENRKKDFGEIYENFIKNSAKEQSSRCSQCGVPYCTVHCPLHNHIPDWLKLAAEDRLEEAYQISSSTNNMPEICGRICPQDRLCEGNCVIEQSGHGSVTIGSVEKYLTDNAFEKGWIKPIKVPEYLEKENSIGIIGAGPAGLAAAEELRKRGYKIDVYDRRYNPTHILHNYVLDAMHKLITSAEAKDDRALGAMYLLTALTECSEGARDAMPWLYQPPI